MYFNVGGEFVRSSKLANLFEHIRWRVADGWVDRALNSRSKVLGSIPGACYAKKCWANFAFHISHCLRSTRRHGYLVHKSKIWLKVVCFATDICGENMHLLKDIWILNRYFYMLFIYLYFCIFLPLNGHMLTWWCIGTTAICQLCIYLLLLSSRKGRVFMLRRGNYLKNDNFLCLLWTGTK